MVALQRLETVIDFDPKRVKKYLFIWCNHGKIVIEVDDKILTVSKNQVLTITSGQYHRFKSTKNAKGYVLSFTLDYMCKTEKDIELIFQNSLFCHFDYNEIISIVNPSDMERELHKIEQELVEKPFQYLESIHSRIELLLFETNRSKIANGGEIWKPDALFLRFLEFVRNNFNKNHSLKEIAAQLQTTELKLNELAKQHAGKTAQNVIYGLLISEAQRILQYEDKRMKEVAFVLGFQDPYYFSKFFKNHTGMSPTDYVKNIQT
ncbi:helix-turn-helix domain-containing protein [Flagellimonas aequoris]|uniref:AraC family transcriptional regulator n=1 Tax=Flagellimonas aequoris TaxID=2306997 RepID=A0A418N3Z7_9FLAO|nr:AraC family transcriptional regulator [Allomuricauda aequoris]RIV68565.1 AraC family transcriptional regulator [Allomuricauda aequoris]TXK00263.1 helix-turn-helix transcriptional regulator [Allomuricauda aequoris]